MGKLAETSYKFLVVYVLFFWFILSF